jgi:hypothetical protein
MCNGCSSQEVGDGGRGRLRKQRESAKAKRDEDLNPDFDTISHRFRESCSAHMDTLKSINPIAFFRRIYNEDKIASYFWAGLFVFLNLFMFFYNLSAWQGIVNDMKNGLLDGTLDVSDTCSSKECVLNR